MMPKMTYQWLVFFRQSTKNTEIRSDATGEEVVYLFGLFAQEIDTSLY